jgi:pimeloyl-ACP methyl ester carboxylesterase
MVSTPDLLDFQASDPGVGDGIPVIFVHGWRGTKRSWDDLAGQPEPPLPEPGMQEPAGNHWHPPLLPLAGFQVRTPTQPPARGLYPVLEAAGHPVVSWTQRNTVGPIDGSVDELEQAVGFAKEAYGADRVILVAHSRGGLVCRGYLRRHRDNLDVAALATMGTPHKGTRLATLDDRLLGVVTDQIAGLLPIPGSQLAVKAAMKLIRRLWLHQVASTDELERWGAPGGYLRELIPESQLDAVRYIAIAGVQPSMSRVAIQLYDLMSFIPQDLVQPWRWTRTTWRHIDLPDVARELNLPLFDEFLEFYPGEGDGVVAVDSALLLTTADTTNVVNLTYEASHSLLLRVTGMHERLTQELSAVESV